MSVLLVKTKTKQKAMLVYVRESVDELSRQKLRPDKLMIVHDEHQRKYQLSRHDVLLYVSDEDAKKRDFSDLV